MYIVRVKEVSHRFAKIHRRDGEYLTVPDLLRTLPELTWKARSRIGEELCDVDPPLQQVVVHPQAVGYLRGVCYVGEEHF